MDRHREQDRYREIQEYVGWTANDARRVAQLQPVFADHRAELIDDFYDEIRRHPRAMRVIQGGQAQIDRLKKTLTDWLEQLLGGRYDDAYFDRRWQIGWRHVEIGLDQLYTNLALARLRDGMLRLLARQWTGSSESLSESIRSLCKLLDIDLAVIQDAYACERLEREREEERERGEEKLLQASRLATIGEMSARLAHESRNALQRLRVCTEMLEFEVEDNPEALRLIARAQQAQDDLQRLFNEVRNYASPFVLEQSLCRLPSLWNEAWNLLHFQRNGRRGGIGGRLRRRGD